MLAQRLHPKCLPRASRPGRLLAGERGSVSAELVVAAPVLLLVMLLCMQFALWSHASQIAQSAASQGLSQLRAQHGTPEAATATTRRLLDQLALGPLTVTDIQAVRRADTAVVTVTGTATEIIPLVALPVRAEASGPVERLVPDGR